MDRNRVLLIGGAVVLVLFLAYILGPGGGALRSRRPSSSTGLGSVGPEPGRGAHGG
jgi:hypothetical protein